MCSMGTIAYSQKTFMVQKMPGIPSTFTLWFSKESGISINTFSEIVNVALNLVL